MIADPTKKKTLKNLIFAKIRFILSQVKQRWVVDASGGGAVQVTFPPSGTGRLKLAPGPGRAIEEPFKDI